jgi:hypothetical protein
VSNLARSSAHHGYAYDEGAAAAWIAQNSAAALRKSENARKRIGVSHCLSEFLENRRRSLAIRRGHYLPAMPPHGGKLTVAGASPSLSEIAP